MRSCISDQRRCWPASASDVVAWFDRYASDIWGCGAVQTPNSKTLLNVCTEEMGSDHCSL
eukprot:scaffold537_cov180-Ochromonas_danica.AAC.32